MNQPLSEGGTQGDFSADNRVGKQEGSRTANQTQIDRIQTGFEYLRVVRFQETDAAGVVYFANLLSLCHEAYEASLAEAGIDLTTFFSKENGIAVPIVHTEADFHKPLRCGDRISIHLYPVQLKPHSFEIYYTVRCLGREEKAGSQRPVATALTIHVCIDSTSQKVKDVSPDLLHWIERTRTLP